MVCIFDLVCELLPPWMKELYLCTILLPLYCTFSLTCSPLPPFPMYSIYRQCVTVGGGGVGGVEMYCGPYSTGVLHSVSDQIQNLQNCFTTPNKMTSKDDIKGLVSLKLLRPWDSPSLGYLSLVMLGMPKYIINCKGCKHVCH
jgi:hypothetical protein